MIKNAHYAGIMLDAPTIPLCPKLRRHNVSNPKFLLRITVVPKEIEDKGYANFREGGWGKGGVNKVHYGLREKDKLSVCIRTTSPFAPGVPCSPGFPSSP